MSEVKLLMCFALYRVRERFQRLSLYHIQSGYA